MNVDSGSVEKTAAMVSAIIAKPEMTNELLQCVPFRFLHEVVFNIMRKTGFAIDRFSEEEKDAKAMSRATENKKGAFLQKLVAVTEEALGIVIGVSSREVIAGQACAKTRQLLQYFCIAAECGRSSPMPPALPAHVGSLL